MIWLNGFFACFFGGHLRDNSKAEMDVVNSKAEMDVVKIINFQPCFHIQVQEIQNLVSNAREDYPY